MKENDASTNLSEVRVTGRISTSTLVRMWSSRFGLDVERLFPSAEMELVPDPRYGFYRFTPVKSGDAQFYASLMRIMGYDRSEKAEFIQASLEIAPNDKVLDVGSGTGNFSVWCGGEYRGIETNPAAVEDAAKLARNVHLGMVQGEEPNGYDVVTVFQVLEHVDDPKAFLSACANCLRPGGRLVVSTPNLNGFMGHVTNEILNYPPHHMSWWSESSLRAIVTDCDCDCVKVWEEPLQRIHLRGALSALFWPRGEKHLTTSNLFPAVEFMVKIAARIAARLWNTVPFIKGHTVMVVATKKIHSSDGQ